MSQTMEYDVAMVPRIKHKEAMQIAAEENRKFAELLRSLQPEDWAATHRLRPLECEVTRCACHWLRGRASLAS